MDELPEVMAISDRGLLGVSSLADWAKSITGAGVRWVQIREKDLSDRQLLAVASEVREAMPEDALLSINGRADVARSRGPRGRHPGGARCR